MFKLPSDAHTKCLSDITIPKQNVPHKLVEFIPPSFFQMTPSC